MIASRRFFVSALVWLCLSAGAASAAEPMAFRLVSIGGKGCGAACPQVVSAAGEIKRDTAETLAKFLKIHLPAGRMRNIVFLQSPGGNVTGAIKLGMLLRMLGSAVVVADAREAERSGDIAAFLPARCVSACVYALMGGKKRVVPPASELGLHRTATFQFVGKDPAHEESGYQRVETPPETIEALTRYVKQMGVSVAVIDAAQRLAPDAVRILTRKEIAKWKLGDANF